MSGRLWALAAKELHDMRRSPGIFVPTLLTTAMAMALPFVIAIAVPAITGERLADSGDFREATSLLRTKAWAVGLTPEGAIQALVLRQFLIFLVLGPVTAAMSSAAFSVIGEKQARTLEPLLATPLTTAELLGAKVLGALVPSVALTVVSFVGYVLGAAVLAEPGVHRALLAPEALGVVFGVGPLAALAALQMAVCVSSRVNDSRSAQQIGAVVILPIAGLLVAQVSGTVELSSWLLLTIVIVLAAVNLALSRLAVRLFDRESILTRWK